VLLFIKLLFFEYRGQTPADAEYQYLEHAKRLDMYGAHLCPVHLKVSLKRFLKG